MEGVQLKGSPRSSQPFGWGAGIIALGTGAAAVAGGLWGLTRPGYTGTVGGDHVQIDPVASPDNVEFISFAGFVIATALLGMLIGLVAYGTAKDRASITRMLFVIAVSTFASWTFYILGSWSAGIFNGVHDPDSLFDGEHITVVPLLRPGPAWLAAPFVGALSYWLSLALSPEGVGPRTAGAEYDERHAENH